MKKPSEVSGYKARQSLSVSGDGFCKYDLFGSNKTSTVFTKLDISGEGISGSFNGHTREWIYTNLRLSCMLLS
jgi:hypothetical protein